MTTLYFTESPMWSTYGQKHWNVKYIIFAPLASPVNFFKYGGGFVAFWNALLVVANHDTMEIPVLAEAYFMYLETKYLPPIDPASFVLPVIIGAVAAGLKWRGTT